MAKIDELHNYAYPDKYLDELHIYDKSKGDTGSYDEIHNYGDRGITYGLDEMHLYGSYQTVDTSIDELNTPKERQIIDIDEYFDEIEDMDEAQKEERKDLAKDFRDILILILMLLLADLRTGNPINEAFYYELTKSRMMDAVEKRLPNLTETLYIRIERYIDTNIRQIVDSTVRNQEQPYFFSEERATSIAVDDAMATVNLEELEEAIKAGYKYKIWVTMHDKKVRDSHNIADGQRVAIDKPFKVGRCLMDAPMVFNEKSDYQDAKEIVNCRCFLIFSNRK